MIDNCMQIITGNEVWDMLLGREAEVMEVITKAYIDYYSGDANLPHSNFLRFPNSDLNRIIALPAFLGGSTNAAGIKWISSFPKNIEDRKERASAVLVLNSLSDGRAKVLMESSIISAKRTAASAVLAAKLIILEKEVSSIGLIGTGMINYEVIKIIKTVWPTITSVYINDCSSDRCIDFQKKCSNKYESVEFKIVKDGREAIERGDITSIATTALKPHIFDLSGSKQGRVILNISLRDLAPATILSSNNVVDDIDHVCRADTSIHLSEKEVGNRKFINGTLNELLLGGELANKDPELPTVFSPFGLGILDIALADYVLRISERMGTKRMVDNFFPNDWQERD